MVEGWGNIPNIRVQHILILYSLKKIMAVTTITNKLSVSSKEDNKNDSPHPYHWREHP